MNSLTKTLSQNMLMFLVLIFPLIFFFRSIAINFVSGLIIIFFIIHCSSNFLTHIKKNRVYLLFFAVIALVFATYIEEGFNLKFLKSLSLIKIPIFFMAVIYTYKNLFFYKFSTKIIKYIIVIFAIFFIDLIYQFIFNENILGFKAGMCNYYNECARFSSFFNDEYIAGGYITLIIIPFFLLINKIYEKKYLMFVPIIILIFVIITGERTSTILALLFNIFYYSITIKLIRNKLLFFIFLILGLIIFLNILLPDKTAKRYKDEIINMSLDDNGDFTFFYNNPWTLHYESSVKIFMDKPFIGHGLKAFKKKCKKYEYLKVKYSNNYNVCTNHPHNFYLEILNDSGLLGFLFFVLFFILFTYSKFYKIKISKDNLILIYFIIILFFPRPTGSIFSTYFLHLLIYSVGMLAGILDIKENNKYKNEN